MIFFRIELWKAKCKTANYCVPSESRYTKERCKLWASLMSASIRSGKQFTFSGDSFGLQHEAKKTAPKFTYEHSGFFLFPPPFLERFYSIFLLPLSGSLARYITDNTFVLFSLCTA